MGEVEPRPFQRGRHRVLPGERELVRAGLTQEEGGADPGRTEEARGRWTWEPITFANSFCRTIPGAAALTGPVSDESTIARA